MQGAPQSVGESFDCGFNQLTSLQGAPQKVKGDFDCTENKSLKSVDGAPQKIGGDFICDKKHLMQEYEEKKLAYFMGKQTQKNK